MGVPVNISIDTTLKFFGVDASGNASPITTQLYDINPAPAIVMLDKTNGTGWGIYATRPVLAEYVTPSSVLVGKQIDSITLDLKKTGPSPPGTAQIGIINPDLSMKKVFATVTAATIGTAYTYYEYNLPPGDSYIIQAGDRIGIKYTAGTTSTAYLSVVRDVTPSDPFDGTNSHLTSYTTSWAMSGDTLNYDLTMV